MSNRLPRASNAAFGTCTCWYRLPFLHPIWFGLPPKVACHAGLEWFGSATVRLSGRVSIGYLDCPIPDVSWQDGAAYARFSSAHRGISTHLEFPRRYPSSLDVVCEHLTSKCRRCGKNVSSNTRGWDDLRLTMPAGEANRKERGAMKLTSTQIEQTLGQFEAEPIPEDHPMVPQLNEVFGEHTYFVNSDGLIILEPAVSGLAGVQSAKVVNLGEWSDDAPSALELHEPETTDLVVTLGFRH